jgi:hypothetical protein
VTPRLVLSLALLFALLSFFEFRRLDLHSFRHTSPFDLITIVIILLSSKSKIKYNMAAKKCNVLVLGGGAVGAIAAVNLEVGGLAEVTAVLRSNFKAVEENGYIIESIDHGRLAAWRPTKGMQRRTK